IDGVDGLTRTERDARSLSEYTVDDADTGNRATILVVIRIVDEGAQGGVRIADGRWNLLHDCLEQVADADAGLRAHPKDGVRIDADQVGHFLRAPIRLCA